MDIKEILTSLGYSCKDCGNYLKCNAHYRGGSDINSITIYKNENLVLDHVLGESFSLQTLIQKTLSLDSFDDVKQWLNNKKYILPEYKCEIDLIKQVKQFNKEIIKNIIPDYCYWIENGISEETSKIFDGGKINNGIMKDRQCLVIYNSKKEIIGLTGRTLVNKKPKWKHIGQKKNWIWPAYLNSKLLLDKKEVILVESPRCVLKLFDCGIKNILCLFGTEISNSLINFLLKIGAKKIYISTNNEPNNKNIGNEAAIKIKNRLLKYFDYNVPVISLPPDKDFADIKDNNLIKEWYNKLK